MMIRRILLVLLATWVLAACGVAVPPEKKAYVGEWRGEAMALLITQDGSVVYKRLKRGMTTSIQGPLKKFEGDNFVVGALFIETTFVVSAPPHLEGAHWKMTVDGVELTRVDGPDAAGSAITL
jgi:hypothetical protein